MQLSSDTGEVRAGSGAEALAKRGSKVRLLSLDDLDKRTRAAQFARETRDAICSDLGGDLSTLQSILVDNLAATACMLSDLRVRWLRGEDIDVGVVSTLSNTFNRGAQMLGLARQPKDAQDLTSYLAAAQAGETAGEPIDDLDLSAVERPGPADDGADTAPAVGVPAASSPPVAGSQ